MGEVLHGSARTTAATRRAIQHSQDSLRVLARRYGINPKTVAKWKTRSDVADRKTGPADPRSTSLSIEQEAIIVAFRRHTLLPLDDCLSALQPTIAHLTRSSLHRCLQRHAISRLPGGDGGKPQGTGPIGCFRIDLAKVRTAAGTLHLFVAIDRTSRFAFVELHETATGRVAADFLRHLCAAVPYRIHTVVTEDGTRVTAPEHPGSAVPAMRAATAAGETLAHAFADACATRRIDHRLTRPGHPWTSGQIERMERTLMEAPGRRLHPDSQHALRRHLDAFVVAYNFARRLRSLRGLTPYEFIASTWTTQPERFTLDPLQQMPGLNC